ncbi:glycoside hydrolase family 75 protein [Podospora didyma]|uniref:Endo-chitosanase n=1 Tax=Podospora didyma TaxID=330526 RepID=A0AAE0N2K1_9PEZI|nr:glycoside hydrolase family 75 protein [Podospora didyma]
MHASNHLLLLAALGALGASARDVPANVRAFYDSVKAKGTCTNKLATGFYAKDDGPNTFAYCGDHVSDYNVIYLKGSGTAFADMDIDCDGTQGSSADDGRCGSSGDTQSVTSFQDTVKGYNKGIKDLDANIHPYVVFGNEGTKSGWKTFDPEKYGIKPLSIIAVVCGEKLIYGIWGDENGDDGDKPMVGEASISLATACFGTGMNGNSGHDAADVLYIAFPGSDAVPGASGASWAATTYAKFESSIEALGDKLIARIGSGTTIRSSTSKTSTTTTKATTSSTKATTILKTTTSSTKTTTASTNLATSSCGWPGHCWGSTCSSNDDCLDPWSCVNKICDCEWPGHCEGTECTTDNDCSNPWGCYGGICSCEYPGHCYGAACTNDSECSDPWGCVDAACAPDG